MPVTRASGIPTEYRGVRFRSRLEARWAAFFDLLNWEWHYEPVDLSGWIPDFALIGAAQHCVFVEVKPIFWHPIKRISGDRLDLEQLYASDLNKVRRALLRDKHEALVVGANIVGGKDFISEPITFLGALMTNNDDDAARFGTFYADDPCGMFLDFCGLDGDWTYRISGQYDGGRHYFPVEVEFPRVFWVEAGNITQWRKPDEAPA